MRMPVIIAVFTLSSGIFSILAVLNEQPAWSFVCLIVGILLNILGKKRNIVPAFAQSFCSLGELITFGTAPGIILFKLAFTPDSVIGGICVGLFVSSCALHLARRNLPINGKDNKGMPVVLGGALVAAYALFIGDFSIMLTISFVLIMSILIAVPFRKGKCKLERSIRKKT
ncbi:hypothetical protein EBB07_25480 [Paenibacillaceae bacterium]|nr:hypothetical protein EBB07_25480 [Paenibacillaceae bacterium]